MSAVFLPDKLIGRWCVAYGGSALLMVVALCGCERETSSAPTAEAEPERSVRRAAQRAEWIDTRSPVGAERPGEPSARGVLPDGPSAPAGEAGGAARESAWARAARGDWAEYAMQDGYRQRLTVVGVGDDDVRLRVEMYLGDDALGMPAVRTVPRSEDIALDDPRVREAEFMVVRETVAAGGRDWDARRVEARWTEEDVVYERITWSSAEAPLSGLVRQETRADGRLTHERRLLTFGRGARIVD